VSNRDSGAAKAAGTSKSDKTDAATTDTADKPAAKADAPTMESRREAMRRAQARNTQVRSNIVVMCTAVLFLAIGIFIGMVLPWQLFGSSAPAGPSTSGPIAPPDGDAQHAWITVPSDATKANAIIVDIHTDYQCPYCKATEMSYGPLFKELNDRGDIIWRQHTRIFLDGMLNNDSSLKASIAAACVDVADDTKYADFHQTIFVNQPSEGTGYTDDQLRNQWPAAVGLTGKALTTMQNCYDAQATKQFVQDVENNNMASLPNTNPPNLYLFGGNDPITDTDGSYTGTVGTEIGVRGTPTFFANGAIFGLGSLFNNDWTPLYTTADDLLTALQQIAG